MNFEFCQGSGMMRLLLTISNCRGIFNVRNLHTGPPKIFRPLSERDYTLGRTSQTTRVKHAVHLGDRTREVDVETSVSLP